MTKASTLPGLMASALAALVFVVPGSIGSAGAAVTRIPLEAAPDQGNYLYKVQRGDTMKSIANRYLLHSKDLGILLNLNRVPDANRLVLGSTVTIPRKLLMVVPARAVLAAYRGTVTLGGDKPAKVGSVVVEGARIETGPNSSASFTLEDGSTVTLPSQSVIRIDRLRLVLASGEMQQIFRLDDGKSQYAVAPNRGPASKFEVRTPVSVSAVRGTEFRIGFAKTDASAVAEVVKDSVAVSAAGAQILVPQGFGAKSSALSVGTPIKLLPPPQVVLPIYHRPDGSLVFNIAPLEKAVRYKLQIASDQGFQDLKNEGVNEKPSIVFASSPVGAFFVRVTAYDANGLEGLPHVYPFVYNPR
ncbi:ferric-dicitrate binding protein FerR (iron transport regulator) [Sphingomonas vulcanisoli]|uniref:Ferric-dicitrate binding protein FerR (Iron transport regulator) n=1 Tax=Sphingomonas vulcanisoli TaxID=1658060 RepID=A0ABX0TMW5_9SPHN|nr:FecR domain-containing protein [Sphingomonas vulcanisoli]NIJ06862.1 ferric-dicitrate binding protein FerR (iron transport regulator) [Sphingomonas vulcanisoli]